MSRQTIDRGLADLETAAVSQRIRGPGAGRKRLSAHQPDLVKKLEALIEPGVRGDPQSTLRWTTLSTRKLEAALQQDGQQVSYHSVANLLHELEYTLQGNRKGSEGVVDHAAAQCAVSVHQRSGGAVSAPAGTGHLGGHEEEGARRSL